MYFFSGDKHRGQPHLEPCQLQFQAIPETLKSSEIHVPGTPTTPVTPPSTISPASSLSLTPDMQSMNIGRGRGRPWKQLIEPSMEGFPEHGTSEEKNRWLKMKVTELWRYNMLTSDQSLEFRKKKNARGCEYYRKKKVAQAAAASGQPPPPPPTPCADDDTPDSQDKAREKSQLQYIKYLEM